LSLKIPYNITDEPRAAERQASTFLNNQNKTHLVAQKITTKKYKSKAQKTNSLT
jgi:hypothetical protein